MICLHNDRNNHEKKEQLVKRDFNLFMNTEIANVRFNQYICICGAPSDEIKPKTNTSQLSFPRKMLKMLI